MKHLRTLAVVSAILTLPAAYADTIQLGSYGTGALNPGVANTAVSYSFATSMVNNGSSNTYNIDPQTTWHAALPNSSYISFDPGTAPGQSYVAPNGDYIYTVSFTLTPAMAAANMGSITVFADDTVAVYLNNQLELAAAGPKGPSNSYIHCSDVGPNCLTPTTVTLNGLVVGTNVLSFDVKQVNYAQEGLDFSGGIASIPEPAPLALFGTGLIGVVGLIRRRYHN